jgi:hypothetical protein
MNASWLPLSYLQCIAEFRSSSAVWVRKITHSCHLAGTGFGITRLRSIANPIAR